LGARAPQRQAYRLVELQRFSQFLSQPLHIKPKYFPVAGDDAARLIVAVRQHDGDAAAMKIPNAPEAEKFLTREYRKGWEFDRIA
jgi:2-hydroxychromene-2-carboxylate isomerase